MSKGPSMKDLADMINGVMGHQVLTEQQMAQIMGGAKEALDRGGMAAVIDYLMRVTQADVNKNDLMKFAESVASNPQIGKDILSGRRKPR
ncbi:hypothetical protein [Mechercharimyces sp. CAU 1602]|uniref:hypothetical protein n=1 Tax=Mechercharimyces sp. CAU 1602 TaxID=2973933 RepID=UPI0021636775|nr:hypothetical protein [Mechercharimyces sp. CAU 1602]MCS1350101.1 hypothetical protein [Mechercharimyces sp. CAU 1602]